MYVPHSNIGNGSTSQAHTAQLVKERKRKGKKKDRINCIVAETVVRKRHDGQPAKCADRLVRDKTEGTKRRRRKKKNTEDS